jgi:arylsulfatase A-like enzyme
MNRPNILLVTFDALTSRDMSVYGYHRLTTPFISEWAKTASIFTRHEAASNYTRSTVASLTTGKRVWTHQIYHSDQRSWPVNIKTENLALLLKNHGYFNIAIMTSAESSMGVLKEFFNIYPLFSDFVSPETLSEHIEKLLFKLFGNGIMLYDWLVKEDFVLSFLLEKVSMDSSSITSRRPQLAFNKFFEVLDNDVPSPYFAWIHLYPPHFAYLPPEPYKGMFDSSLELQTLKSQHSILDGKGGFSFINEMQHNILRARYDEFIRYCDNQFSKFITRLEKKNRLKNTVIILSADHGESFDHGYFSHGGPHLFETVTNIPLIIKEFGQTKGQIINDLIEQIDIPATILDLANVDVPSWMEGRSIVPLLRDNELPSKPIYSMNFENSRGLGHRLTEGTIAVWRDDYKLIHYLDTKKSLLFDLKKDADELYNLSDKELEKKQYLLSLIQDSLNKANENISKGK